MKNIVVIGAGHGGVAVASSLRNRAFDGSIHLIGDEQVQPYNRPAVSKELLLGTFEPAQLALLPSDRFVALDLDFLGGEAVSSVDIAARRVHTAERTIDYDALVFATGAVVRPLRVPGATSLRVRYLRNYDDALVLREEMRPGQRVVMIGAGFIGLEAAAAAVQHGCTVTVIEAADRVMARAVAPAISEFFEALHREKGVSFRFGAVAGVEDVADRSDVVLSNGERIAADVIVVGIGVLPADELARAAGIACDDGIIVDEHTRTNAPDIYAIGDCARHPSRWAEGARIRLESVQNAHGQAVVCAANILGDPVSYDDTPSFWSDQYDAKLQMIGLPSPSHHVVARQDPERRSIVAVYHDAGRVTAGQVVNDSKALLRIRKAMRAVGDLESLQLGFTDES